MAVYLVTGASSGIGWELASQAVARGHRVFGLARREDKLAELAKELGEAFTPVVCDVTDRESVARAVKSLPELPDVAFLNAGIGELDDRKAFRADVHERTFKVNYFGVLYMVEALFEPMAARGHGVFAVTSSLAGYRGLPNGCAYSASKAAISTAFEGFRLTYRKQGLRFVNIHPGFITTPMTEDAKHPMPFLMTAEKAARRILSGVESGKWNVNFPWPMHVAVGMARLLPSSVYRYFVK